MRRLHRHPDEGFSLDRSDCRDCHHWHRGLQRAVVLHQRHADLLQPRSSADRRLDRDVHDGADVHLRSAQEPHGWSVRTRDRTVCSEVNAAFTALGPHGARQLELNGGAGIDGVADTYPLSDPAGGRRWWQY